ncbi:MAG: tetratricopeptide repeat protein [Pseudoxanthomonas sp.]
MAVFVCIAIAATLAVLLGVLWPLRRESRGLMIGAVLASGVATFALYRLLGTPAGVDAPTASRDTAHALDEAIASLRAALEQNPDQPEGWRLLGKTLATRQDYAGARDAFARALALDPDNADLLVEAAETRMYANPNRLLDDEALKLLHRALEIQPGQQRARWFVGVSQRQNGQPAEAAKTWEPLLAEVDARTAQTLRVQIDSARADAGLPALPPAAAPTPVAATPNALTVKVSLAPGFAERVRLRGDASVFVTARLPDGPPMPVAAEKHALSELPLTLVLDDNDSPMPTQKLSALPEVEVRARISASGSAMRSEGDIESAPVRVKLPADKPAELILGNP